jgi:hypothetical protein
LDIEGRLRSQFFFFSFQNSILKALKSSFWTSFSTETVENHTKKINNKFGNAFEIQFFFYFSNFYMVFLPDNDRCEQSVYPR